ncbi:putative iron-regulated protein [Azomonas agilis]|uniref:Putative iron-regulated protein n=1 Tax=Azomonas agilis TaxID=116849 RepID=A0A562J276_9GAMM|nr:imelysin family protein [Azomonas agilis]TWH77237.1 putative iron-regulated protein [Azomonas agilis]
MLRASYWAFASLLAVVVSLAGCDERHAPDSDTPKPQAGPALRPAQLKVSEAAARAVVEHYADLGFAVFTDAHQAALQLQTAVRTLLATPTSEHLQATKNAWIAARVPYMQTEVFRFSSPVVNEWERQVNAWPINAEVIDYVARDAKRPNNARTSIIANPIINLGEERIEFHQITASSLSSLNELAGPDLPIITGYHALEFLLWGEEPAKKNGAGQRPATDYAEKGCTNGHCDRRRAYLEAVTELLVTDLADLAAQWQPEVSDNYRAALLLDTTFNGIRKILVGMGSLSLDGLATERMQIALDTNAPEAEHDRFSDNTHNALFYNAKGIRNVYLGTYQRLNGSLLSGASLANLVQSVEPDINTSLQKDLADTETKMQALVDSANQGILFDQLIAPHNSAGQTKVRDAITALVKQSVTIEQVANSLGIEDLTSETADRLQ